MAKREISSTLRNLKFMQRATQREEKSNKEEVVIPDGNFQSSSNTRKRCTVIMEGDPIPGATKGRMSFQSYNPSIDKLNEESTDNCQPQNSATCPGNQNGRTSDRESRPTQDGSENLNFEANGELKRKQTEVVSETHYPNKSQKNIQVDPASSKDSSRNSHKQPKNKKVDWNVLRPPKGQKKRE